MSRQGEETDIADCTVIAMSASEAVLLNIGYTLHDEPNGVEDDAGDVSSSAERWLSKLRYVWRIQDGYW